VLVEGCVWDEIRVRMNGEREALVFSPIRDDLKERNITLEGSGTDAANAGSIKLCGNGTGETDFVDPTPSQDSRVDGTHAGNFRPDAFSGSVDGNGVRNGFGFRRPVEKPFSIGGQEGDAEDNARVEF
jgi:hypothetical protein